jgi:3-methyladenine DNA glycosylase AlkD
MKIGVGEMALQLVRMGGITALVVMKDHDELIHQLQNLLQQSASPKTKEWWEKYLQNIIPFRGVGIPAIRTQLAQWREASGVATWAKDDQLALALALFEQPIAEDKLAGILFLQEYLYDQFDWGILLKKYEALYVKGLIFDWNTCDWFCVRVLGPTIAKQGRACAKAIATWRTADNLWQARSSVVAFVPVVSVKAYYPLILRSCAILIHREERFAKTAVGWILRDLSKEDMQRVRGFVEQHLEGFTVEALKNALKYLSVKEQQRYLHRLKAA